MPDRPHKCPLCHSVFRTESGMKSHLARQHETPAVANALATEYAAKSVGLQEENTQLKQKLHHAEARQMETDLELAQELAARAKDLAQIQHLRNELNEAMMQLWMVHGLVKERLGIALPNPFKPPEELH